MHELRYIIPPELDGKALRAAALGGLRMSYGQFKRAKFRGQILLDGAPAHADARVRAGQLLVVRVPEDGAAPTQAGAPPLVSPYEDDDLLVADKPAPLPSLRGARQSGPTLENAVYAHLGCPEGFVYRPVNRLDKGTSGLMLIAKNAHAQQLMQRELHTERFMREYLAVAEGAPDEDEGVIDLPIGKADGATVRREVRADGRPARTLYRVEARANGRSLIRLRLDTGRTHQIRVHLLALGCPVVGDFLYGAEDAALPGRFALHSAVLAICHPVTGERLKWESPLPGELQRLLGR